MICENLHEQLKSHVTLITFGGPSIINTEETSTIQIGIVQ